MARTTTKKQSTTEQLVQETPSQTVVESPVVEKQALVKKCGGKKASKTVASPESVSSVPEETPVVDVPLPVSGEVVPDTVEVDQHISEQSSDFLSKVQQLCILASSLKNDFKQLEKKYQKDIKVAQKQSIKKKRKMGNRAPSGFVKPTRISDELANFLNKPIGTEMARTSVTRDINEYIRTNKLQDENNGRKIIPDEKLGALLKLSSEDELTYFNLQKYMSCHFAKNVKPVVVAPVV